MKITLFLISLIISAFGIFSAKAFPQIPDQTSNSLRNGPEQKGAFHTGHYDNLLSDLVGKSQTSVQENIDRAFDLLFFGNDSTQRVYYPDRINSTMGYIEDIGNGDVRSEGMSYGMMIAVQMDRKDVFDRIWKWAKTHMQFKDGPHAGYFAWHCRTDGSVIDSNTASDGEEWFVMSLFFASGRWGNGSGIFDYENEANGILHTMLHKEDEPEHGRVTNMFDGKEKLVKLGFVPTTRASMGRWSAPGPEDMLISDSMPGGLR